MFGQIVQCHRDKSGDEQLLRLQRRRIFPTLDKERWKGWQGKRNFTREAILPSLFRQHALKPIVSWDYNSKIGCSGWSWQLRAVIEAIAHLPPTTYIGRTVSGQSFSWLQFRFYRPFLGIPEDWPKIGLKRSRYPRDANLCKEDEMGSNFVGNRYLLLKSELVYTAILLWKSIIFNYQFHIVLIF